MKIKILKTDEGELVEELRSALAWADTALLAVSYANYRAFELLRTDFQQFLRRNGKLRTIFDIDRLITEKRIIEEFSTIPGDSECKIYETRSGVQRPRKAGNFHPKTYLFTKSNSFRAIIGSSNFTIGGLRNNVECNIFLSGIKNDIYHSIDDFFWDLWNDESLINVLTHYEILEEYQKLIAEAKKRNEETESFLRTLRANIEKKSKEIEKAKKGGTGAELMYFLGLLSANGEIDFNKGIVNIKLFRGEAGGKEHRGYYYYPEVSKYRISQSEAHRKDIEVISEKIKELLISIDPDAILNIIPVKGLRYQITISSGPNSKLFNYLKTHKILLDGKGRVITFIPKELERNKDRKIIMSFLRGYCDLKSRISLSDGI